MTIAEASGRVRVPKTAEVVAAAIRRQVVSGQIAEGESLPSESELMSHFGVSRPSLREAFRILEAENLIEVRRGSKGGALAMRPDVSVAARYMATLMQFDGVTLMDVFEARMYVEPIALRLIAQRDDRAESVAVLRKQFEAVQEAREEQAGVEAWVEFFVLMFERAGNRTLALVYGTLTQVVHSELADSMVGTPSDPSTSKAVSKALALAEAGKGDQAADYWRRAMASLLEKMRTAHSTRTLVDAG